jgi:hypothetical protein
MVGMNFNSSQPFFNYHRSTRMKLHIIPIAFILLLFANCKKKEFKDIECQPVITINHSNDTIFPSDYLMAYPGSWWKYSNGIIDSCKAWTVIKVRTTSTANECQYVEEDQWIVPEKLKYNKGFIANTREISTPDDLSSSSQIPIISESIGIFYNYSYSTSEESSQYNYYRQITNQLIEKLDSMQVGAKMYYNILHIRYIDKTTYYAISAGPEYPPDQVHLADRT